MKAKEWVNRLIPLIENKEAFEDELVKCLKSLCEDANQLIKIRRAKSDNAVAACINEVNNKWLSIRNGYRSHVEKEYESFAELAAPTLLDDGFKAAYVQLYPNRGWYFDLKKHKSMVDNINASRANMINNETPLFIHEVIPYNELTLEKLDIEIMDCILAIGSYVSHGMPPMALKPLAYRISLLKYWKHIGEINLEDVEKMEEDPTKFFKERGFV